MVTNQNVGDISNSLTVFIGIKKTTRPAGRGRIIGRTLFKSNPRAFLACGHNTYEYVSKQVCFHVRNSHLKK